jgi:signal transduction histidine kinase
MSASESTPGDELGELRRRVLDLQTAYETAQRSEAAMSLAIAGLRRGFNEPLSVLVPLVDLMLLEAEDRRLPLAVLADLATLRRHLERLCRAAAVVSVDAPDRGGLFDLNAVLRETVALVADPFAQRDIRVHMALDAQIPPICGNPVTLGQVLMSFLTSAHDTVGAGGVVWVETASTDSPVGARLVVRLVARDDGNGVADTVRATSGKPLLAIEPESTGLELSIVRGIVESHGGTLELRSHAGVGKTWIVLLPGRNGHRADP